MPTLLSNRGSFQKYLKSIWRGIPYKLAALHLRGPPFRPTLMACFLMAMFMTHVLEHLGFETDSTTMTTYLTQDRREELGQAVEPLADNPFIRQLMCFIETCPEGRDT